MEGIRERLTYANVMATVAVFIALGGSAWALSRGEVKSKHIAGDAVRAKHIDFGVRSQVMLASFDEVGTGTGSAQMSPTGESSTANAVFSQTVAPQTFTATGLRARLPFDDLAAGTRRFIFVVEDQESPLQCTIEAGERGCKSAARVKVRKGEPFWFMERHAATSETDDAQVAWQAVLP